MLYGRDQFDFPVLLFETLFSAYEFELFRRECVDVTMVAAICSKLCHLRVNVCNFVLYDSTDQS
jgi:hypothetical protein